MKKAIVIFLCLVVSVNLFSQTPETKEGIAPDFYWFDELFGLLDHFIKEYNEYTHGPEYIYFTNPNYSNVGLSYDPKSPTAHKLNADAERLLKSLLAEAGISSAIITSTRRTYDDQARIMQSLTDSEVQDASC